MGYSIGSKEVAQTLVRAGREKPWTDRHGSTRMAEPVGIFMRTQMVELDETAYAERDDEESSSEQTEHTPARCLRRKWDDDHHLVEDEGTIDAYNVLQTDLPQGSQIIATTDTRNQNILLAIAPSEVFGTLAEDWNGADTAEITLTDGFLVKGKGTLIAKAAPTLPDYLEEGTAVTCRFIKAKNDWFFFRPSGTSGPTKVYFENWCNSTNPQFYDGRVIFPNGKPVNLPVQGMYDILDTTTLNFIPGECAKSNIFLKYGNSIVYNEMWSNPPGGVTKTSEETQEESSGKTVFYGYWTANQTPLNYGVFVWEYIKEPMVEHHITTNDDGSTTETELNITVSSGHYTIDGNSFWTGHGNGWPFVSRPPQVQELHTVVGEDYTFSTGSGESEIKHSSNAYKMLDYLYYTCEGTKYLLKGNVTNTFSPTNHVLKPNGEKPEIHYFLKEENSTHIVFEEQRYYAYSQGSRTTQNEEQLNSRIRSFERSGQSDAEIDAFFTDFTGWQLRPSSPVEHGSYYLMSDSADTNGLKFDRNLTYRFFCLCRQVLIVKEYLSQPDEFRIVKRDSLYILDKNRVLGNELPDDVLNFRCGYCKTPDLNTHYNLTEDQLEDFFTLRDAFDGTVEPNEAGSYMNHKNADGETCDLFVYYQGNWQHPVIAGIDPEFTLRKGQPIVKRDDLTLTVQTTSSDWHQGGMVLKAYIYTIPERELDA